MSSRPKILVTSACGKTGLPTVLQLLEKKFPVRAFVRQSDHRSQMLERAGAEIFIGNQYSLKDMRLAMKGVKRAYQCAPTAPNGLHFNTIFMAAAYEERIEHAVTLSQWLSSANHPSQFTRDVYVSDILLKMRPEMTVTNINVGWFADNYLMVLDMAAHLGIFAMPLGDGNVKKNAPPSNEDIASVVVGSLIDPSNHVGRTYRPTGPELISPNEIATAMGKALKRKVRYQNISEKMMLKALKAIPPSNYSEAAATQLGLYAEEYRRRAFAINAPTNDVELVGQRAPETFESIVRRHVENRSDLSAGIWQTLNALLGFTKVLLTSAPDVRAIEIKKDYIQLESAEFCQQDPIWQQTHQKPEPIRATGKAA